MKELQDVLRGIRQGLARNEALVMATVVRVEGSAYRHPGARLLLGAEGPRLGCVSGGCLEGDIQERAGEVLATGRARLLRYDLNGDLDLIWGTGSGCEGVAEVLLEPLLPGPGLAWLDRVEEALRSRQSLNLGTVFEAEEGSACGVGEHRILMEGESLPAGCTGLVERLQPPVALWILGAGEDARPLAEFARILGWKVGIADHRPGFLSPGRFAEVDSVLSGRPEATIPLMHLDARSAVVLLSHSWERDKESLRLLLPSPAAYIGLLGHRRRGAKLLETLAREGFTPAAASLHRLFSPVGLDLGGQEPGEIALAIVAEIVALLSGRTGGHLRDRQAAVHG
jgi:xanthine/CO dehydrogenase XdhC/CoxF family maturation factor